ncbi:MAG: ABC transporter substrate-binding protein [Actinomycetota bacterium]|nr:ABC transporter substrate-binding protein [Actinomycetota bacterium]
MRRHWRAASLLVPIGALAAGFAASPTTAAAARPHVRHASASGTLTISNESGSLWTCNFNPFNAAVYQEAAGFVYEPLVFVNALQSGKTTPWLASSYKWSNGNKVLTFTIRKGVKWSDGKPLTAADVAFTFNMLKKNPALDLNSIWSVLSSVVQKGDNVVLTFKSPAVPYFYYVADQVFIVPQHIWAKVKNPVTYPDTTPVGSGPYTVSKCTGQNITYTANAKYWQPGLPKIETVQYPAFTSNDPANVYLATGQAQWGGQFIPSIKSFYLAKSPNNHYWFPPVANVSLFINQKVAPLNQLPVRQAMAFAINRSRVAQLGEYGYEPAANQTGIVTPTFSSWYDKAAAAKYGYTYNPAKAISILKKAGYKKGSNGYFAKGGKELAFSVINVGGNSDWVADLQIIQQEFKAVGIKLTVNNLTGTDFDNDLYKGNFQLGFDNESGGPAPYYELRQLLYSGNTAPIGQLATTNYERYSNPATDKLFNEYASTTSSAQQHAIVNQLEHVMLSDVPVIPVTESVDWFQYNTASFSGWVTEKNPYAQPAPYNVPDVEVMLLHLRAK